MSFYRAPEVDTVHSKDVFAEASEGQRFRRCVSCGARTTHTNVVAMTGPSTEYDNVLIMDLSGGYSMFFDDVPLTVIVCHDCAHELCVKIPWLGRLLDPYRSHSHTQLYHDAHPDHFGWDYLTREVDDRIHAFFTTPTCSFCSHESKEHAYGDPARGFPCYVCEQFCPPPPDPKDAQ